MKVLCTNPATRRMKVDGIVVADNGVPQDIPDALAKQLINTGHFEEVKPARKKTTNEEDLNDGD